MTIQYKKIIIRIIVFLLLLLSITTIVVIDAKTTAGGVSSTRSLSWMIDTYPIPDIQSVQCRSTSTSYYRFCDPDQLIKNDIDRKRIENAIKEDRYVIVEQKYNNNRNQYNNRTNPYLYNITNTSDTTTTTAVNCIPKARDKKKRITMNGIMKWIVTSWMMTKSSSNDNSPTVPTIKVQYGVALMNKMNLFHDNKQRSKDYFAKSIHNKWNVGYMCQVSTTTISTSSSMGSNNNDTIIDNKDSGVDNTGIMIILSKIDRYIYIQNGSPSCILDHLLTKRRIKKIINGMKVHLERGLITDSILYAIDIIDDILINQNVPNIFEKILDFIILNGGILLIGIILSFVIYTHYRDDQNKMIYQIVKNHLHEMDIIHQQALNGIYLKIPKSCPICLQSFVTCSNNNDVITSFSSTEPSSLIHSTEPNKTNNNNNIHSTIIPPSNGQEESKKEEEKEEVELKPPESSTSTSSLKILTLGSDHLPIKLLSSGYAYNTTCYEEYMINNVYCHESKQCPISDDTNKIRNDSSNPPPLISDTIMESVKPTTTPSPLQQQQKEDDAEKVVVAKRSEWDKYWKERCFRLKRLYILYPRYISMKQIQNWTNPQWNGILINDPIFISMNPNDIKVSHHASGIYRKS